MTRGLRINTLFQNLPYYFRMRKILYVTEAKVVCPTNSDLSLSVLPRQSSQIVENEIAATVMDVFVPGNQPEARGDGREGSSGKLNDNQIQVNFPQKCLFVPNSKNNYPILARSADDAPVPNSQER